MHKTDTEFTYANDVNLGVCVIPLLVQLFSLRHPLHRKDHIGEGEKPSLLC